MIDLERTLRTKTGSSWSRSRRKLRKTKQVIETALANPKDKFKIGIRKLIERFMIQRLEENGKIVTRYVEDQDFQNVAFDGLADEIFESVLAGQS
jgi:type I restriction enzyme, R subunit